ncbi:MAG: metallophosphoesterase family protein [Pseudomonadota bacterium]
MTNEWPNQPSINVGNRAFIFGGAYGNLQATKAVLDKASISGYSANQIIFTGDTVAYCGQPQETVNLIRNAGVHVIQGNCEESLGADSDNCGCGFDEGSTCNLLSVEWYRYCRSQLDIQTKLWMAGLPQELIVDIGEFRLNCLHGSPSAINEFVFPSDMKLGRFSLSDTSECDGYIVGHSGIPFLSNVSGKAWINSGSAGMPANDGTTRIWYATLEARGSQLIAEIHALEYDYLNAAKAMAEAGLNSGYMECLSSGIWPSLDVLPDEELTSTGKPLKPQKEAFQRTPLSKVA